MIKDFECIIVKSIVNQSANKRIVIVVVVDGVVLKYTFCKTSTRKL